MADQDQGNQDPSGSTTHLGTALRKAKEISQNISLPTSVQLHSDGRINVSLALKRGLPDLPRNHALHVDEFAIDLNWRDCPCMSIVIMVVGSRGDVQPYVALGKRLKQDGHRIRIATHDTFRQFVIDQGLEFFNIGGNPVDLMSYMVRNPGMIPGMLTLTNGDLKKKKAMLKEIIYGCWKSCYAPSRDTKDPFVVDAIISNPPGFAHIHCAEALGIPLQMSFTMPWCPTTAFPHPLVNITNSDAKPGLTNYLTYYMADLLTWQGLGNHINKLRKRVLNLEALDVRTGPSILEDLKIPWTYCVSPALVPSPEDWQNHIDVVGFYFLNHATKYEPPSELVAFLNAGDTPIYIGFGSIVVDNPHALTKLIFEATAQAGVRALVSAGWGGLGGIDIPPHIFILESIPHDWLFDNERVSAVVHHGGAGTTAIGLARGRPTVVVPFFGDQRFWGRMIHRTGAGPKPIPHKKLTIAKLSDAIKYALSPTAKEAAQKVARQIHDDNGIEKGVQSFYQHLPLLNMRCDMCPTRLAVWWSTKHCLKLSALAAQTLERAGLIEMRELELHRTKEYEVDQGFSLSGEVGSAFESVSAAAEKLFSPVKNVFGSTSVPRGILNMTSSFPESPIAEPGSNSIADDLRKQEASKTRNSWSNPLSLSSGILQRLSLGLFHRDHEPSHEEREKRRRFSFPLLKNVRPFRSAKKKNHTRHARHLYVIGVRPLSKVEEQRRKERLREGIKSYTASADHERNQIVEAFRRAKGELPARRNTYIDAAKMVLASRQRRGHQSLMIDTRYQGTAQEPKV